MRGWLRRRREARRILRAQKAHNRLHGIGAVPKRGRSGGGGFGDFIGDLFEGIFKIFD